MTTSDFLPFADDPSANVVSQATYLAAAWRLVGFTPGIAESAQANKPWRQATFMSAVLAEMMRQQSGLDVLDDGDLAGKVSQLLGALSTVPRNARIVTLSANFSIANSDYAVGLNRTVAPAATQITLPTATAGFECVVEDLAANFDTYNVTVIPPAGTISGRANYLMNEKRQKASFRYYGSNIWSVGT